MNTRLSTNLTSWDAVRQVFASRNLSTAVTTFPTYCTSVPAISSFPNRARGMDGDPARTVVFAEALHRLTNQVVTPVSVAWLLQKVTFDKAITFMTSNVDVEVLKINYHKFTSSNPNLTDPYLTQYRNAVKAFRTTMNFTDDSFKILTGNVKTELRVGRTDVPDFLSMVRAMVARRGNVNDRQREEHYLKYIDWMSNPIANYPEIPLEKRNRGGKGIDDSGEIQENLGQLLLTTAIVQAEPKQIEFRETLEQLAESESLPDEDKRLIRLALIEFSRFNELVGNAESEYSAQIAATDIVFNSFFWIYKCGITHADFINWNLFFHQLASRPAGKKTVNNILEKQRGRLPGITALISNISMSGDIHLPPFILTTGRLSDLYSTIGGISSADITKASSPSWRNVSLFSPNNQTVLHAILELWRIEQTYDDKRVMKSEHILHQLLLQKTSPFQWSGDLNGNALNVTIIQ